MPFTIGEDEDFHRIMVERQIVAFLPRLIVAQQRCVLRSPEQKRTRRARKDMIERRVLWGNTFFSKCHRKQGRVNVEVITPDTVCPNFE